MAIAVVGQQVVCRRSCTRRAGQLGLQKGAVYTVQEVLRIGHGYQYRLSKVSGVWNFSRFQLAKESDVPTSTNDEFICLD